MLPIFHEMCTDSVARGTDSGRTDQEAAEAAKRFSQYMRANKRGRGDTPQPLSDRPRRSPKVVRSPSPPPERPRSSRRAARSTTQGAADDSTDEGTLAPLKGESDAEEEEGGSEKKARFVWTTDLHRRFETAVNRLGVSQAKPQAIRQLMGCETEDEPPTRQNIKSHLQKYRLQVQKQATHSNRNQHARSSPAVSGGSSNRSSAPASASRSSAAGENHAGGAGPGGGGPSGGGSGGGPSGGAAPSSDVQGAQAHGLARTSGPSQGGSAGSVATLSHGPHPNARSVILQQQQRNAYAQIELAAKIHERMTMQRRTQHALGLCIMNSQRRTALSREQLQRLAQHVVLQRLMLQHLYSMLHACHADLSSSRSTAGVSTNGIHGEAHAVMGDPLGGLFPPDESSGSFNSLFQDVLPQAQTREAVGGAAGGMGHGSVNSSSHFSSNDVSNDDASSNADASNLDGYDGFGLDGMDAMEGLNGEVVDDLQMALDQIPPPTAWQTASSGDGGGGSGSGSSDISSSGDGGSGGVSTGIDGAGGRDGDPVVSCTPSQTEAIPSTYPMRVTGSASLEM